MSGAGQSMRRIADAAVERARGRLRERFGEMIATAFYYGAVDIATNHLVVWVLLSGDPGRIPEWCFDPHDVQGNDLELRSSLIEAQHVVRTCLYEAGWPNAFDARVGFDSDERVRQGGGWYYFK